MAASPYWYARLYDGKVIRRSLKVTDKRDAIKAGGAYPAFTLALTIKDANALLARGWPNAKKIGAIPEDRVAVILICEERCLSVLMRRE